MTTEALVAEPDSVARLCNNRIGDVSEFEFCRQATLHGWRARHMSGAEPNYDVIISRVGSRSVFVQVKRAYWDTDRNAYRIRNKGGSGIYSPCAYDILAAHMEDIDKWVFYTRAELGNRSQTTYTPPHLRTSAVSRSAPPPRNPDNWDLLDEVAQSFT